MFEYTDQKLAKDIKRLVGKIEPSLKCQYNRETRQIVMTSLLDADEKPKSVYLGNLLNKVRDLNRKERIRTIETFLSDLLNPQQLSTDTFLASLALRVRTDFEVRLREQMHNATYDTPMNWVSIDRGGLVIELVADREETITSVTTDNLSKANVTVEEAIKVASATLCRATDEHQWQAIDAGIWLSSYQDDYDFARLIAAETHVRFPFDAQPLVFAPSHSLCFVADADAATADSLRRMVDAGNDAAENHRSFCQTIWTMTADGAWVPWCPDPASPLRPIADLQCMREIHAQYDEQKGYLDSVLAEDMFVATFTAYQNGDSLSSRCVYTFDNPSYLPETDYVALVDPERPDDQSVLGQVTWQAFCDCVGADMFRAVSDVEPPYFACTGSLTSAQKETLRSSAVPL